jgi:hypothetical protein
MLVLDQNFGKENYDFEYVRREFLGNVRCLLFDVKPKNGGNGKFTGRIWVEDKDYNIVQGNAGPDEFRTTPLWGVGQRIFFMHDGRTADLLRAVREHFSPASSKYPASEANAVVHKFNQLTPADQQAILDFLRSL